MRRTELKACILSHRIQSSDPSTDLLDDSEDEVEGVQVPARLAHIQQLAMEAAGAKGLPSADEVFALAAQGKLTTEGLAAEVRGGSVVSL